MMTSKELQSEKCLFAFNIWDINSAKAVMDAAAEMEKNVILQTSASIYKQLAKKQLRDFIDGYAEEKTIKVWLHLDHCSEEEMIYDAISHHWDSVMIDASQQHLSDNINITNRITAYAHERQVLVESEVGQVRGTEDDIIFKNEKIASEDDIKQFLKETNVDMLAVAFGNAHGVYQGTPDLHYELIEYTGMLTPKPFVVHGGSGLSDEILSKLITMENVKKINISTEVKLAYREGILQAMKEEKLAEDNFQAIKVESCIQKAIGDMVKRKLALI